MRHIQLKNARDTVDDDEALTPHAEQFVRTEGGARRIARWFFEPTDEGGLIDFEAFAHAVAESAYSGWIVVESDQSPAPGRERNGQRLVRAEGAAPDRRRQCGTRFPVMVHAGG